MDYTTNFRANMVTTFFSHNAQPLSSERPLVPLLLTLFLFVHLRYPQRPDSVNFDYLNEMYGTTLSSEIEKRPTTSSTTNANRNGNNFKNKNKEDKDEDDRNRGLGTAEELPDWVLSEWRSISVELRGERNQSRSTRRRLHWKTLHTSPYANSHEIDIGGGYTFRVHKLFGDSEH